MRTLHIMRRNFMNATRPFLLCIALLMILILSGCMGAQDSEQQDAESAAPELELPPTPEKVIGEESVALESPKPEKDFPAPIVKPPATTRDVAPPKDIQAFEAPMMAMPPRTESMPGEPRMTYMHQSVPQNMYLTDGEPSVSPSVEEPIDESDDESDDEKSEPDVVSLHYGTNRNLDWGDKDPASSFTILLAMTIASIAGTLFFFLSAFRHGSFRRGALTLILLSTSLYLISTVWTATQDMALQNIDDKYGTEPDLLSVGTCKVTIPPGHVAGVIERPSPFKWEFVEDRLKHVVVEGIEPLESDAFYQSLHETLGKADKNEVFLFVHGFNQTFEQAAQRTAQIAYDTEFQGAAVFFSWPSQGSLLGYNTDSDYVKTAVDPFREFLTSLCTEGRPTRVHILAHSMGNRLISSSFQGWDLRDQLPEGVTPPELSLILAAPDVDAEWFKNDVANELPGRADRVTLYTSPNDLALLASQEVNGDPRLGMWRIDDYKNLLSSGLFGNNLIGAISLPDFSGAGTEQEPPLLDIDYAVPNDPSRYPFPEIESVVFTTGERIPEKLGHGYYAHHPNIIADLRELIDEQRSAAERTGTSGEILPNGGYVWRIK